MRPVLVVGGSGTLGKVVVKRLLDNPEIGRIRVLSRNEHNQIEMARLINSDRVDYLMGDVRDRSRMVIAAKDCETVFHFAATKSVDKVEYNPFESVLTNIIGTYNVIQACRENNVSKAVFTSTDKAVSPITMYGACKLVAEKLWISSNIGSYVTRFACVRYGNVLGSAGSVVEKWRQGPPYKLTDPGMTRFFMTIQEACDFVLFAWKNMSGGEIYIPKMKATTVGALFEAAVGRQTYEIIGRRDDEKIDECLISEDEADMVTSLFNHYIRWPATTHFRTDIKGTKVDLPGGLTSRNCEAFTDEELRELCK
jgi:UDP-N-acetylglucosamine 4,6-dehydratase